MRGTRAVAVALVGLALGGCGTTSKALSPLFPIGPTGAQPAAPAPAAPAPATATVHLGDDERLAPVERLLSSAKGKFNAALFLSAFDVNAQACDIGSVARRFDGHPAQSPLGPTPRAVGFGSSGSLGSVELMGATRQYVLLRRVAGKWIVDENACLWMSEIDGSDIPPGATSGLTELAATDPRRAPVAALLHALIHKFDVPTFLGAFDLADQPCDVPVLARSIANQTTSDLPSVEPTIHYYARPIDKNQAGVLADAGTGAFPVRIRRVNGHWLLAENACTWLTILVGAHLRGEDRGVQSDLRNALTAEKTIYTDAQTYSASTTDMKAIEPSLDWGKRLRVSVGDVEAPGDRNVVCLSEGSASGRLWAIADIAVGPKAGTYFGAKGCPSPLTADAVALLGSSFDATP